MTRHISVADTAKIVRTALKAAFPTVKFSVRSKSYSGGASIDVSWQDGPTEREVDFVTKHYEGATFDGMIDLKSYQKQELNGEAVWFGADFIFTHRTFSLDFLKRRAVVVASKYDQLTPEVFITKYGGVEIKEDYTFSIPTDHGQRTLVELIYENARRTRAA